MPRRVKGRDFAFGASQGLSGALLLIANLLMGFVWTRFGASAAFFMSAALSGLAAVLILALVSESVPRAAKEHS